MGLGPLANALVQMELGESSLGALSMNTQGPDDASMMTLLAHGTEYQKEKFLKPLLNGEKRICFSMTEKAAGADATGMQTRAVKDGNENYILNGEKWFSSSASVADIALVMAKTDPDAPRHKQFSTFIVELPNPGYNIKRNIKNMAIEGPLDDILGGGHSEIEIKDLKVPAENLLGGEGNGFNMGQHRLAYGRLRHGMHNVAMAQRALDMATAHVTKRSTFGVAARRPPGGAVHARRLRQRALHGAADAAAHRLQGGKGPGPARRRTRSPRSSWRTWCTRWSTPRSSCTARSATARIRRWPTGTPRSARSGWSTAPTKCTAGRSAATSSRPIEKHGTTASAAGGDLI